MVSGVLGWFFEYIDAILPRGRDDRDVRLHVETKLVFLYSYASKQCFSSGIDEGIAIVGCLHGQLNDLYSTLASIEEESGNRIDLVLICGDFQAVRNHEDLKSLAAPAKYSVLGDFWAYYARLRTAPYLTLFVGGNHESSNYMSELPFGGWVSENIYYMGKSSVVNYRGLRIAGLSGIFKERDFSRGYHETPPFSEETVRSVYHVRNIDVLRLGKMKGPLVNVFLSHDWPLNIHKYGDTADLKRRKEHLAADMDSGTLGSPASEWLLDTLKPSFWFAAHLHVQFAASLKHCDGSETRFLALDKPKPDLSHIHLLEIECGEQGDLCYDPFWINVLRQTEQFVNTDDTNVELPQIEFSGDLADEKDLAIPAYADIFEWTVPPIFCETGEIRETDYVPYENTQTVLFSEKFGVKDPLKTKMDKISKRMISVVEARAICEKAILKNMAADEFESSDLDAVMDDECKGEEVVVVDGEGDNL